MASGARGTVLIALLVAAAALLLWSRQRPGPGDAGPRFTWVATAHQLGVVGYRDPVGAISPDGRHVAYSEGRYVRVVPIGTYCTTDDRRTGLIAYVPPADVRAFVAPLPIVPNPVFGQEGDPDRAPLTREEEDALREGVLWVCRVAEDRADLERKLTRDAEPPASPHALPLASMKEASDEAAA